MLKLEKRVSLRCWNGEKSLETIPVSKQQSQFMRQKDFKKMLKQENGYLEHHTIASAKITI